MNKRFSDLVTKRRTYKFPGANRIAQSDFFQLYSYYCHACHMRIIINILKSSPELLEQCKGIPVEWLVHRVYKTCHMTVCDEYEHLDWKKDV